MLIINPGSGPVDDGKEEHAIENMKHYLTDCGVKDVNFVRIPQLDCGDGRFTFLVWKNNVCHEIQMPGIPLEKVRYMDSENQNIWNFPRLYVDGSSWVWKFGLLGEEDFIESE